MASDMPTNLKIEILKCFLRGMNKKIKVISLSIVYPLNKQRKYFHRKPRYLYLMKPYGEERWKAIGTTNGYRYLLVIHTYISDDGETYIRIISARKMGKKEVTKWL